MILIDDGIRLNAQLDMPREGGEKCPLVILIHGFTGHMEERHILAMSAMLNEIGFATLRADMYGHGKSEGEFKNHTLFKWISNILTLVDYARGMDFVTDLYLCGHSQGGLAVILAAALERDVIRGLIPLSPATVIPEQCRRGEILGASFDPEHIPDLLRAPQGWVLGGNYLRVAQSIRVEDAIDRYTGPVLLVHGDADASIPVQASIDAAARYRNAQLAILRGDTHCYDFHLDEAVEAVRAWMLPRR